MSEDEKFKNALLRRLDILIALQLDKAPVDGPATSGKIERLLSVGALPAEIARIVGKPVNYVTAVMAMKNKRANGRRRGRPGKQ